MWPLADLAHPSDTHSLPGLFNCCWLCPRYRSVMTSAKGVWTRHFLQARVITHTVKRLLYKGEQVSERCYAQSSMVIIMSPRLKAKRSTSLTTCRRSELHNSPSLASSRTAQAMIPSQAVCPLACHSRGPGLLSFAAPRPRPQCRRTP